MTRHEVVADYLAGRIDRREFVRRLTIAGVSAAAIAVYADSLTESAAAQSASLGQRGYVVSAVNAQSYPTQDTDEDGFTDQEEEECGSDPNDPNSFCENNGTGSGGNQLPNTGAGPTKSSGSSWLAPIAAAGAGLAIVSRRLRRGIHPEA